MYTQAYTLCRHSDTKQTDELDQLAVDTFLITLAEVALAIATRNMAQAGNKDEAVE